MRACAHPSIRSSRNSTIGYDLGGVWWCPRLRAGDGGVTGNINGLIDMSPASFCDNSSRWLAIERYRDALDDKAIRTRFVLTTVVILVVVVDMPDAGWQRHCGGKVPNKDVRSPTIHAKINLWGHTAPV